MREVTRNTHAANDRNARMWAERQEAAREAQRAFEAELDRQHAERVRRAAERRAAGRHARRGHW